MIADLVLRSLLHFVLWWVCLPLIWVFSFPVIGILSLIKMREGGLLAQVRTRYRNLTEWWEDCGERILEIFV